MRKIVSACVGLAFWWALAATSQAQDIEPKFKTADSNNAVIQGKVVLPSGFAAERYFRVTLKNLQTTISTIFTNKNGEFQIRNLSEGTYYVEADVADGSVEPVVRRVELGRGLMVDLTLELRDKKSPETMRLGARVVSAAELRQSVPASAKKEYALGLKLVGKGDFLHAAERFEAAVSIYPEYIAARNDLGAQYLKLSRLNEAERHFQIVLANDPKNFNAKYNMGLVHFERRDYVGAISQLNEALAIDSSRPVARLWIGVSELEMGDFQDAEAQLTKSLVMGGTECVAAHYHLARIYVSRGDAVAATKSLNAYLDEAPRGEYAKEAKELKRKLEKGQND